MVAADVKNKPAINVIQRIGITPLKRTVPPRHAEGCRRRVPKSFRAERICAVRKGNGYIGSNGCITQGKYAGCAEVAGETRAAGLKGGKQGKNARPIRGGG